MNVVAERLASHESAAGGHAISVTIEEFSDPATGLGEVTKLCSTVVRGVGPGGVESGVMAVAG